MFTTHHRLDKRIQLPLENLLSAPARDSGELIPDGFLEVGTVDKVAESGYFGEERQEGRGIVGGYDGDLTEKIPGREAGKERRGGDLGGEGWERGGYG